MRATRFIRTDVEVRAVDDGAPILRGYGAVYNRLSQNLGGFVEQFAAGAFAESIAVSDDQYVDFEHVPGWILGRVNNGTARFESDGTGVTYEATLDLEDPDAKRVHVKVGRGDVQGSSIVFSPMPGGVEWGFTEHEFPLRTITKARLWAAGPVVNPAYLDTTAEAEGRAVLTDFAVTHDLDPEFVWDTAQAGELRSLIQAAAPRDDEPDDEERATPVLTTPRLAVARRRLELSRR